MKNNGEVVFNQRGSRMEPVLCSYCGKEVRKRYWFNPFNRGIQCDRLVCRLRSGHWLRWHFRLKLVRRKFTISVPWLRK